MKIGIIIARIGGEDGVALETEKWMEVLMKMGHEIFLVSGRYAREFKNATLIPEIALHYPDNLKIQDDAFFQQEIDEKDLIKEIDDKALIIRKKLIAWLEDIKPDLIIIENASALPCHLALGLAIKQVLAEKKIKTVSHDHDFYWEREDRYKSRFTSVQKILKECFPLNLENVKHAVINSYAKTTLKNKLNIDSVVIPNVMDFNKPYGVRDDYNSTLRKSLDLKDADFLLFQITRIVRRKGIETAIKSIYAFDDPRIKLIITGSAKDDYQTHYYRELVELVRYLALRDQVIFAPDLFEPNRAAKKGKKIYSISDAYANAKACTYFSAYEGFGNAFVEAICSKTPIFVNDYKPVFTPDIGEYGFKIIMLENSEITHGAVSEMKAIIYNDGINKDIAEHNFEIGKKYFSFDALEKLLNGMI